MKKLMPLLAVGILVLGGLGAVAETEREKEGFLSETVVFSQPIICEKEEYISLELAEATSSSWEIDKPMLPVVTKVYTFPFGTHVDNVKVSFSDSIEQKISKLIRPMPELYPLSINTVKKVNEPETLVTYSDIDVYPENQFSYRTGAGLKDGEHVIYLTVSLKPVQYIPQENTIFYSTSAVIDISYTPPENPVIFPDEYDLLIITPAQFESALQPLVDHKNGLDPPVRTIMVSLDDILPSGGFDEQEDIKYFIRDAIEDWGITYVILVGAGVEGQELFPVRYAWIASQPLEDNFPSDLYYADVYNGTGGFSNWDYNGNGKYAEWSVDMVNVDVHPDVYLGKLPCNNVGEVNTIVNKIIDYKAHNKMTKKILQGGGDSFTSDSIYEGEHANTIVMTKLPGYSTTQLWGSNGELTKSNIAKGFNSGVDFVDLCGHGSWASFATHPPKDDETWVPPATLISQRHGWLYWDFDFYMTNNAKKLPVCVYKSCSNGKYTKNENCLSWKTVSKSGGGGIATFSASGIGYGATGTDIVETTTGWMEVHTFEELISTKILGQVWANDITDYYNTFESNFEFVDYKTMLEWAMFGDPTLVIEDGDDPINIPVNKPVFTGLLVRLIGSFPRLARLLEPIFARLN